MRDRLIFWKMNVIYTIRICFLRKIQPWLLDQRQINLWWKVDVIYTVGIHLLRRIQLWLLGRGETNFFLKVECIIYYQNSFFFSRIQLGLLGGEITKLFWKIVVLYTISTHFSRRIQLWWNERKSKHTHL